MKKYFYIVITLFAFVLLNACTSKQIAKQYGGTVTIEVPKGEKLIECTWKDGGNLWYLTEPMEDDYVPKTKTFREESNYGIMEGKVVFIESR